MARGSLHGVQVNKIPPLKPPAPSLPPHKPGDLDPDYVIRNLDCRITYASNFFRAQIRSIHVLGRYVTAFKAYAMEHAKKNIINNYTRSYCDISKVYPV
ncbi:hypothetical protein IWQ61_003741 [Dispira simplex]|nr:hypothetical protein IWQ61_003741 [Dispira simplex]